MLARDIMTTHIVSIEPDASVRDAARLLSTYHISGAPVVDADGVLVGLVTEADIISKAGKTVADIMTRRVLSVPEDTAVDTIAQMLTSKGYKRVPVSTWGNSCGHRQPGGHRAHDGEPLGLREVRRDPAWRTTHRML